VLFPNSTRVIGSGASSVILSSGDTHCFNFQGAYDCSIENLWFDGITASEAVNGNASSNLQIAGCDFHGCLMALQFGATALDPVVFRTRVRNSTSTVGSQGAIYLANVQRGKFLAVDVTDSAGNGYFLGDAADTKILYGEVSRNGGTTGGRRGINFGTGGTAPRVLIGFLHMDSNAEQAVYCSTNSPDGKIVHCVMLNHNGANVSDSGTIELGSSGWVVDDTVAYPSTFKDLQDNVIAKVRLDATADRPKVKDWINRYYSRICVENEVTQTSATMVVTAGCRVVHAACGDPADQRDRRGAPRRRLRASVGGGVARPDPCVAADRDGRPDLEPDVNQVCARRAERARAVPDTGERRHAADLLRVPADPLSADADLPVLQEPYATECLEYGACFEAAAFKGDPAAGDWHSLYADAASRLTRHLSRRVTGNTGQLRVAGTAPPCICAPTSTPGSNRVAATARRGSSWTPLAEVDWSRGIVRDAPATRSRKAACTTQPTSCCTSRGWRRNAAAQRTPGRPSPAPPMPPPSRSPSSPPDRRWLRSATTATSSTSPRSRRPTLAGRRSRRKTGRSCVSAPERTC
jgi:hypothetical protein